MRRHLAPPARITNFAATVIEASYLNSLPGAAPSHLFSAIPSACSRVCPHACTFSCTHARVSPAPKLCHEKHVVYTMSYAGGGIVRVLIKDLDCCFMCDVVSVYTYIYVQPHSSYPVSLCFLLFYIDR